eukprot:20031-Eustigmatos_ZCMA.PRE.1
MRNAGISPNVHTYTSLLKGSARHGDVDEMMHIFKAMVTQVRFSDACRRMSSALSEADSPPSEVESTG